MKDTKIYFQIFMTCVVLLAIKVAKLTIFLVKMAHQGFKKLASVKIYS